MQGASASEPGKQRGTRLPRLRRLAGAPRRTVIGTALERFSRVLTDWVGTSWAFGAALAVVAVWAITGPLFGFSDTWQLVINTGTTIVTFLMVFLIQSTQNRDSEAIQVKLDELIRISKGGHNALLDLEELEEEELDEIRADYCKIAEQARAKLRRGGRDTGVPEVKQEVAALKQEV